MLFSAGLLLSNFLWNSIMMVKPFSGGPVPFGDYFTQGQRSAAPGRDSGRDDLECRHVLQHHRRPRRGPALSYGLGQGATMVGAFWGVFIWKEFKGAPPGTNKLLAAMFLFYLIGLGVLIASKCRARATP